MSEADKDELELLRQDLCELEKDAGSFISDYGLHSRGLTRLDEISEELSEIHVRARDRDDDDGGVAHEAHRRSRRRLATCSS